MQLVGNVYTIVVVPATRPDTTPVPAPIVATEVALLLHVPPVLVLLSVVVAVAHTCVAPVIAAGVAFTVASAVRIQPPGNMYVIIALPAVTPVTTPKLASTVAIDVLPLVHVPPVVALARVVVNPSHTCKPPVITAGSGFTVATSVRIQPVASI